MDKKCYVKLKHLNFLGSFKSFNAFKGLYPILEGFFALEIMSSMLFNDSGKFIFKLDLDGKMR